MLVLPDREELRTRFTRRGEQAPTRRSARYMAHFDAIWQLQAYFIGDAERHGVPVIPNIKAEHTVRQVLNIISDTLIDRFHLSPKAASS